MDNNTNMKKGGISVDTAHIFPVIKKWLYSEKEIFLREIISNSNDAVTKLKRLSSLGEVRDIDDNFKITVTLDADNKTLTVSDNGIGMTKDELEKYLCQIALSGAVDFIQKYDGENASDGIIGHFGLGFYSSFMVSDTVTVITKSYLDSPAVKWICEESGEYEIGDSEKSERGTDVIMNISDDEAEYLSEGKIKEILDKYCSFMPTPIYFNVIGKEKKEDEKNEPVNDVAPLWQKQPGECTDEEYKAFYKKVFNDFKDPLFYIHINADYPLNFKGILYFPKLNSEYDSIEGQIKLYYNQVFVSDNIKEVVPEFMTMLKGVLDCPELPLNVSRSYLQNSGYVKKISAHIVKKIGDKLNGMFSNEREQFQTVYNDIKPFIEYGAMRDNKFYQRIKDCVIFPSATDDKAFYTIDEYLEAAKKKHENTIYYATDKKLQAQFIEMFSNQDIKIIYLDRLLDTQFINTIEQDRAGVKFVRIDADVASALKEEGEVKEDKDIEKLFKEISGNENLKVTFERLKDTKTPAIINTSEEARRFEDMMRMYKMENMPNQSDATLVINTNSELVTHLCDINSSDNEKAKKLAKQIYSLALLSQRTLTADEMKDFLASSYNLLLDI